VQWGYKKKGERKGHKHPFGKVRNIQRAKGTPGGKAQQSRTSQQTKKTPGNKIRHINKKTISIGTKIRMR
jgi:hypothetical protein